MPACVIGSTRQSSAQARRNDGAVRHPHGDHLRPRQMETTAAITEPFQPETAADQPEPQTENTIQTADPVTVLHDPVAVVPVEAAASVHKLIDSSTTVLAKTSSTPQLRRSARARRPVQRYSP
ncbi:unnamed protein product, partial [Ixodes persulcatus]